MDFRIKTVNLYDTAQVERAIRGKRYPPGVTLITLSASSSTMQCDFIDKESEIENRYAVVIPNDEYNPRYLNIAINRDYQNFKRKFQTTINTQMDSLKFFEVHVHICRETQNYIAEMIALVDDRAQQERDTINELKDMKKYYMKNMFP